MKPTDILKTNRPPSIIVFGSAGSGKTALVSQIKNAYMFDFDDGMRTAATLKDKFYHDRQQIEFDVFKDPNPSSPEMYHNARVKLMTISQACRANTWKYDALIVDSLTGLSDTIMRKVMKDETGDALNKPERNHWGAAVSYMDAFFSILRSINKLVILTAHINSLEDDNGNVLSFFPSSITRNHGLKSIPWMMDEVWYASRQSGGGTSVDYFIDGGYVNKYMTRTRSSIGKIKHNDIGMIGLLKLVGYTYGKKKTIQ